MASESTPVVPANRLLEVAQLLADGAARLHDELRDLSAEQRQSVLDAVAAQVGDIVRAWSELVQAVVTVEHRRATSPPGPETAPPPDERPESALEAEPRPGPRRVVMTPEPASTPSAAERPDRGVITATPQPRRGTTVSVAQDTGPTGTRLHASQASGLETATMAPESPGATEPMPGANGYARDELTGVLNRQSGYAAIDREIERCRREGQHLVLGYLNVDGMREINESGGPRAGDELLRKVAAGLRATLRSYDVIMRLAGDEFLFSLPGADVTTAEKRLKEFGLILGEEAPGASVSVGFAEAQPEDSIDDLVSRADDALVQARRRRGRRRLR